LLLLWACSGMAAPSQALGYVPKYAAGFTHFDYVNPMAPKGGRLMLSAQGALTRSILSRSRATRPTASKR
jgi:microcin C transport system substrate-binding protein